MKIAILTDTHFGVRNNSNFFIDRLNDFFYDLFIPYLKSEKINTLFILGDIFENRKLINTNIINESFNFFQELKNNDVNVYCILGNHDIYYNNTNKINTIQLLLKQFNNVYIIEKYSIIDFDNIKFGFIGWFSKYYTDYDDYINFIKTCKCDVLCGHLEINNILNNRNDIIFSDRVPLEIFRNFEIVLSGHIHTKLKSQNINYLGNPIQSYWGDYNMNKGFHILDTGNRLLRFIPNIVTNYDVIYYNNEIDIESINPLTFRNKIIKLVVSCDLNIKLKKELPNFINTLTNICFNIEIIDNKDESNTSPNTIKLDKLIKSDTIDIMQEYINVKYKDTNYKLNVIQSIINKLYNNVLESEKKLFYGE